VRLELQADCYAGVWGFYAAKRNLLDPGDAEEGAARRRGGRRRQRSRNDPGLRRARAFTHGKAEQRMKWFQTDCSRATAHVQYVSRRSNAATQRTA
jgi:predicted metalloprotease